MSITINTEVMERAGRELEEIASKLKHLEADVGALNASISNCFMQGGVGSRPSAAYSSLCGLTQSVGQRANALRVGALTYEETEERMSEHAQSTGSAIENGYNLDWVDRPDISDLLLAGGIIGAAGAAGAAAGQSKSLFEKFMGNDLKYEEQVSQIKSGNHTVSFGKVKAGTEIYGEWDSGGWKDGKWQSNKDTLSVGVEAKGSVSAINYNYGGRYGEVDVNVGTVRGKAQGELQILKDGKFDPKLEVDAEAKAEFISGSGELKLGDEDLGFDGKVQGAVGTAGVEGKLSIDGEGFHAKGEVGAAALSGKATGTFKLFGIKIEATAKGELGAVGVGGEFESKSNSFTVGGKLSAIAGLGFKIKVSW